MSEDGEGGLRRVNVAYGAVVELTKAINENMEAVLEGLKKQVEEVVSIQMEEVVSTMLSQHASHLKHHEVEQQQVDPYKIVCWFGCEILKHATCQSKENGDLVCPFRAVGSAIIGTLCGLLAEDSEGKIIMAQNTRDLLLQMLVAEKLGKKDQGIWQNGLYAAFHCSVGSYRCMTESAA